MEKIFSIYERVYSLYITMGIFVNAIENKELNYNPGAVEVDTSYNLGDGSHQVKISGSGTNVSVGAGYTSIKHIGNNATIDASGAGNKKITSTGHNKTILTGDGHDEVSSLGDNVKIDTGSGNDKVTDTPVVSAVQEEPDRTPDKEPAADTSSISDETPKQQPTEEVFEEYPDGPFAPWPDIIEKLMSRNLPLFGMMSQTSAEIKGGKILVYTDNPSLKQYLLDDKRFIDLYDSIIDVTGRKIRTAIVCTEDRKKEEASSGPVETMKKKIEEFYSNQGE